MAKPKCLICAFKLSKRDRKYIEAAKTLNICTDCCVARNKVASKMKRR